MPVETPPALPSFSMAFKICSLSSCRFLSISWTCAASFFRSSALALSFAAGWFNLSRKSLISFSSASRRLVCAAWRLENVLNLAGQFVNLLLRRGVLPARDADCESEDKKPKRNLSHAPKINCCAAASR